MRDPESVYVYWSLLGRRSAEARRAAESDVTWYLRVLNLSDGTSRSLVVDPDSGNFYVEVTPGETYGFELAVSADESWRTVCRTERVRIPPGEGGARNHRAARARPAPVKRPHLTGSLAEITGLRYETTRSRLGSSRPLKPDAD